MTRVFLVPGFFGFTSIRKVTYFHGVKRTLEAALARRGIEAEVIPCPTRPTGSIRRRAERLLEGVIANVAGDQGDIHFVGHSTGGIDVRVLLSPGMRIEPSDMAAAVVSRTRSAILVASPNRGSPLAAAFLTIQGKQLLKVLAALATSTEGRHAIWLGATGLGFVARIDDALRRDEGWLDRAADALLRRITAEKDDPLWRFLHEVSIDQGAVAQLLPETMDLVDAALPDRRGVAYGCVVTAAPRPPWAFRLRELASVEGVILASLFMAIHNISARENEAYPYPRPPNVLPVLRARLGMDVDGSTNDGIVPTLSQVHGRILDAVVADHLDVVGQFRLEGGNPFSDWLPSGSRFDAARFEAVWDRIAGEIAANSGAATRRLAAEPTPRPAGEDARDTRAVSRPGSRSRRRRPRP
ncbi:MAG: hypothetical protein FJ087_10530 [Deltaproteobacteria bacterium]|nr:hypothetical protein [Deltaproteobacteria bacterium]